ncbi:MAG: SDR family NAD(P)-dependent oxidoreductase [Acidobacteria bacterium]|nr:SDR family NAD(P)-dependent oxidoreductase [Acidobacteriota bacterium]
MEITGKIVVITGASMGIGESLAREFVAHAASVVLLSRDAARAEAARGRIGNGERTLALPCDVRRREQIDRVIALTLRRFHRIDVWINNAGHGLLDAIASVDMAACREMFESNLFGAIEAMQAVIPVMRQQGSGTIINISSVAGHIPLPFHATYSASKFALNAISKAARIELAPDKLHVMSVCPGYVRTSFRANAVKGKNAKGIGSPSQRGISAARVARATLAGYRRQAGEIVVPWYMHLPIKLYQCFPSVVEYAMGRMARSRS